MTKPSDPATQSAGPAVKARRAATKTKASAPAPAAATVAVEAPVAEQPAAIAVETIVPATHSPETQAVAADEAPAIAKEKIMENTIKDAAAKGQAYFAEFNDRAKAVLEKSTRAAEDLNAFGKGNVEALVESGKIAAKGLETLGQGYAEFGRKSFEGATATLKSLAAAKTPTEFLQLQSDYVRSQFDALVAETSKSTEAFIKLAGDVAQPISNRVAVAAEKIKVAA